MSRHFFSGGHDAERRPRAALPGRPAPASSAGAGTARTTSARPRPGCANMDAQPRRAGAAVRSASTAPRPTSGGCAGACSSCRSPSCSATTAASAGGSSHYLFERRGLTRRACAVALDAASAAIAGAVARDLGRPASSGATRAWSTACGRSSSPPPRSVYWRAAAAAARRARLPCWRSCSPGRCASASTSRGATGATARTGATRRSGPATSRASRCKSLYLVFGLQALLAWIVVGAAARRHGGAAAARRCSMRSAPRSRPSASPSRRSATRRWRASRPTRRTAAGSWTAASGATRAIPTTSARPASGGASR